MPQAGVTKELGRGLYPQFGNAVSLRSVVPELTRTAFSLLGCSASVVPLSGLLPRESWQPVPGHRATLLSVTGAPGQKGIRDTAL